MTHTRTLGIDFGTDRLFAAVTREGAAPVALDIGDGSEAGLIAQVALGDDPDDGQVLMGYPATRPYALFMAERTAYALLRLVGRTYAAVAHETWAQILPFKLIEGERGDVHVELRGKAFSPEQLLATLLTQVGVLARDAGCEEPLEAAVALPVALGDAQRRAVARAAQLAGFGGLSFVHAPVAAALELARRSHLSEGHALLVLDWGAGALEGAVLTQQSDGCQLRAVVGDNTLGGMDLDAALVEAHIVELTAQGHGAVTETPLCRARLGHAWRRARVRLAEQEKVTVHLPHLGATDGNSFDGTAELTRELLDEHLAPLLQRAETLIAQLVAKSDVAEDAPVTLVLLGGMLEASAVHKRLEKVASKAWRGAGGAKPTPWAKLLKQQAEQASAAARAADDATEVREDSTLSAGETTDEAEQTDEGEGPSEVEGVRGAADAQADSEDAASATQEAAPSTARIATSRPLPHRAQVHAADPDSDARTPAFVAIGAALLNQRMADAAGPSPISRLGAPLMLHATLEGEDAPASVLVVPHNTPLPHSYTFALAREQTTLTLEQGGSHEADAAAGAELALGHQGAQWLGELRVFGVTGKHATATFHVDIDGLIEVEAHDAKGNPLEIAWLARPGLTHDELMVLARAAWVSQQRRAERNALIAAEERASALGAAAERQLENLAEDAEEFARPLAENLQALNNVLAQPLDLQQIELFEHERSEIEREANEMPPSPRQLRCERLLQQIYALEISLGRAAQAPQRTALDEAAS